MSVEHIYFKKGGQIKKVEKTNKSKISAMLDNGFDEVELTGGKVIKKTKENSGLAKQIVELNKTIKDLTKENSELKSKLAKLTPAKK